MQTRCLAVKQLKFSNFSFFFFWERNHSTFFKYRVKWLMHANLWRWYYISAYRLRWLAWTRIWNREDPAGRDERLQGTHTHAAASMETIKPKHLTTSIILVHLIGVRDGAINLTCHTTTYLMRYQTTRGRHTGTRWHFSEKKRSYSRVLLRQSVGGSVRSQFESAAESV